MAKLHKPLAAILVGKEIPWATQAALGASGYVTVEDLADRWDTPAAARENGPRMSLDLHKEKKALLEWSKCSIKK